VKISLIIPIYNRTEILDSTLQSIVNQRGNWECILVDDHSTENVADVCKKYISINSRFRYVLNSRTKGAPSARNEGAGIAKGEYIFFFDSDNLLHENTLLKIEHKLEHAKCDVLVFYGRVLDKHGEQENSFHWKCNGNIQQELLTGKTYVDNNLSVIKKESLLSIGLTDENCPSYQEWDTHIRLSEICTYTTLEEELIDYIRWDAHTISSDRLKSADGLLYVLEKHNALFKKYPKNLLNYGMQVQELINGFSEIAIKKEIHNRINKLIPNFVIRAFFFRAQLRFWSLFGSLKNKLSIKRN
jgi:glycosyltransferase involved in cell wall biosynthesis